MKLSYTNKILLAIIIFLTSLAIISFTPLARKNSPKIIKSAFLNSKYANEISEITITENGSTLILKKNMSGNWKGIFNDIIFPADTNRISNFINSSQKIRNLYVISENLNYLENYGLDNDSRIQISFLAKDNGKASPLANETPVATVNFNFSENNVYLFTDSGKTIYKTDNEISPYLTAKTNFWAEPFIVPRVIFGKTSPSDIQHISFTDENGVTKNLTSADNNFINAAQYILELRHGGIMQLRAHQNTTKKSTLSLWKGDGHFLRVNFFLDDSGSYTIFYEAEDEEIQDNFSAQISAWTYNNILKIF